ncbi:hypothetical protein H0A61_02182 [Koleobacter methoxysyntrophicus]|jgi:hypothetical protein|uniref:Uncharacterized protein n=1 Tax=Koleobacter methoxysyntrophicus TaxID=2751313 RepID=A0A8A0RN17_9FIRM|nr:DUF5665 domain-containing protein [Koleobacter methoxysyntrophicus]QSQ09801.1 hypothetical protein H0A61_02182 [Koleobacter methoxysyntrophicus]
MEDDFSTLKKLLIKIEEFSIKMEKMRIAEYVSLMEDPIKILYTNFLAGIARGIGMAVGFTLLGAITIYILQKIVILNLPLLGDFIADIVKIVQDQL